MLRYRLAGAFCLIVPLFGLMWLDDQMNFGYPGVWLAPLAALIAAASAAEMVGMFKERVPALRAMPAVVAVLLFSTIAVVPVFRDVADCPLGTWGWAVLAVLSALASLLVGEILRYDVSTGVTARVAFGFLASVYVALPMCFFLYLRSQVSGRLGLLAVISVIFVVKCSDAGAYFTGRSLGRHKLAPKISPGKTIEGALGGTLTAILAAWLFHVWIVPQLRFRRQPRFDLGTGGVRPRPGDGGHPGRSFHIDVQTRRGPEGLGRLAAGSGRCARYYRFTGVGRATGISVLGSGLDGVSGWGPWRNGGRRS